jgi:hypothetical protein
MVGRRSSERCRFHFFSSSVAGRPVGRNSGRGNLRWRGAQRWPCAGVGDGGKELREGVGSDVVELGQGTDCSRVELGEGPARAWVTAGSSGGHGRGGATAGMVGAGRGRSDANGSLGERAPLDEGFRV